MYGDGHLLDLWWSSHSILLIAVQLLSHVQLFATTWTAVYQAFLSFTISWSLFKLMSRLCHPLLLLPSMFPSIRVFSNESFLHIRWPKYWSFSISPSSEYSGLISFKVDWFDLLVVQGTFKSLLQHQVWKHQLFSTQPSLWSNSQICMWLLEKP